VASTFASFSFRPVVLVCQLLPSRFRPAERRADRQQHPSSGGQNARGGRVAGFGPWGRTLGELPSRSNGQLKAFEFGSNLAVDLRRRKARHSGPKEAVSIPGTGYALRSRSQSAASSH